MATCWSNIWADCGRTFGWLMIRIDFKHHQNSVCVLSMRIFHCCRTAKQRNEISLHPFRSFINDQSTYCLWSIQTFAQPVFLSLIEFVLMIDGANVAGLNSMQIRNVFESKWKITNSFVGPDKLNVRIKKLIRWLPAPSHITDADNYLDWRCE